MLVAGIISSGRDDKPTKTARYNLKQKRSENARRAIENITRAGISFEGSSTLMESYFTPANVYGSCLQLYPTAACKRTAGRIALACIRRKRDGETGTTFNYCTKADLTDQW